MDYTLTCSCGWTHEATTRKSATEWKKWHREQYREKGSRLSETGHDVKVEKKTPTKRRVMVVYNELLHSYFVFYITRQKFGRYAAAQFSDTVKTEAQVKAWVRKQKHLELLEDAVES